MNKLLLLAVVLFSQPLVAQESSDHALVASSQAHSAGSVYECFDLSTRGAAACVSRYFEESERKLVQSLAGIRGRLVRDRDLFEETQARWVSFKDSECELRSVGAQAYGNPSVQKPLFVQACTVELNVQRIHQLQSLALGCDSCLQ